MFYERREDILAKFASRLSIIGLDYQVNNAVQHNRRSHPMFPEQQRVTQQINHLMDVMVKSECEIRPHFFLTGPTGSGKSFLVNQVAKQKEIHAFDTGSPPSGSPQPL